MPNILPASQLEKEQFAQRAGVPLERIGGTPGNFVVLDSPQVSPTGEVQAPPIQPVQPVAPLPQAQPQPQQPIQPQQPVQDATIAQVGQQPQQTGGQFQGRNFERAGRDVFEIMPDGTRRFVSDTEFATKLQPQGLNLETLPQLQPEAPTAPATDELSNIEGDIDLADIIGLLQEGGEEKSNQAFNLLQERLGLSANQEDFDTNPFGAVQGLISQVFESFGLKDTKSQIEKFATEIEELENKRDDEIRDVNNNPWLSTSVRAKEVNKIQDAYEDRINNRTNRLKLLQETAREARQQAQFAANLAVTQFNKERDFEQGRVEFLMEQAEKRMEAERKAGELTHSIQDVGGRTVRFGFDNEGNIVSRQDLGASTSGTTRQPTQGQFLTAGYAQRIQQAQNIFSQLDSQLASMSSAKFAIEQKLPNVAKSDLVRNIEQAERNFVNSVLRRESGAAIAPTEFESATRQYFVRPGDDPQTIAQKQANRALVLQSFIGEAGGAFNPTPLTDFPTTGQTRDTSKIQKLSPGSVISSDGILYRVEKDGETLTAVGSAIK